jgi:hypothetical protein
VATIERVPVVGKTVLQVAMPLVGSTATGEHPEIEVPSAVNTTVPEVGAGETVAVKMTPPPMPLGFASATIAVVVVAALTVSVNAVEVLVA